MSSNNLDKYKYLAGENLDLKPSTEDLSIIHWVIF